MKVSRGLGAAAVVAAAALTAATFAGPALADELAVTHYDIVDLGKPTGNNVSHAYGISSSGDYVVGRGVVGSNHAYVWSAATGMTVLPNYSTNSMAVGVNNAGVVVGTASTGAGVLTGSNAYSTNPVPVMWKNGVATALATSGRVYGINNNGLAVGSLGAAGTVGESAVIYNTNLATPTLSFIDATTADGITMNTALGISDGGMVYGTGLSGGASVMLAYDSNTQVMTRLGQATTVAGVNANGVIVGSTGSNNNGTAQPYSWSAAAGLTALALPGGLTYGTASGINDAGWVVGTGHNGITSGFQPYLIANGEGYLLNNLLDNLYVNGVATWSFTTSTSMTITGIGDNGVITGYAELASDSGRVHAFALVPVPEPGSWALMLAGLAAMGGLVRRRTAG